MIFPKPEQVLIGHYPLMTEKEALMALESAEGTLSVSDALRVFSIRSLVAVKSTALNKNIITTIVKEDKSKFLSTDFIF